MTPNPRLSRRLSRRLSTALALVTLAGCSTEKLAPDVSRDECENLNPLHCLLPFPSSRYLVEDSATVTGRRIRIPAAAMPKNNWGEQAQSEPYSRFDGFSPMTTMMTVFDGELDTSDLPGEDRIPLSLTDASPTVVLDAVTGERVAHFSEINEWEGTDFSRAAFYIRPATRLKENHRYIVAVRRRTKKDGAAVEPSTYFRALRDEVDTDADELEGRRQAFEDIFAKLTAAGVERAELIQAWDFHTASGQSAYSDLLSMRDDAMQRIGQRGLGCTVTKVQEDYGDENLYRRVEGTFTVPLYLDNARPGARINRDASGKPAFNGMAEARFILTIPHSVKTQVETTSVAARLLQYGHGLMGGAEEVGSSFQRKFFNDYRIVGVATDWWGMSEDDTNTVASVLGQLGNFPQVGERLTQGILNQLVLTRAITGVCADLPELQFGGRPAVDPAERYFLGISQGSIFGTTVAAVSQDIERFILNVGGISYPIMIIRSVDFPDYNEVIQAWYPDSKLDTDLMMVMIASFWDLSEPATYASHIIEDPLPNTPAKKVLYTIGQYDAQVPNVSSDIAARTIGLPVLVPSPYEPFDVPTTMGPVDSAYVVYDVGAEPVPLGSKAAAEDNVAHGAVRRNPAAQRQMDAFMRADGVVRNFCDGACDPD